MAKSTSGPPPWSHEDFWKWREGFKRVTSNTAARRGLEWSLSSGWHEKKPSLWDNYPRAGKTKKVKLYNGRTVEVPDADYEDFIGHRRGDAGEMDALVAAQIEKVFIDNEEKLQEVQGVGHITMIDYSPTYQMMRVFFETDGAVVVFFRVPKEVYSELKWLAESGATSTNAKGEVRHVLGMRFWDIVRIRGQREGSRYRYEYTTEGAKVDAAQSDSATAKDDMKIYDDYAKNFLQGTRRQEYDKLKSIEEKEQFLKKAGIL